MRTLHVPQRGRRESLREIRDSGDKLLAKKLIRGPTKKFNTFLCHDTDVHIVGHTCKKCQCFALDRLVGILETVQDDTLMFCSQGWMILNDICQRRHTQVLQVLIVRTDETTDRSGCTLQKFCVWIYLSHGSNTFVHNRISNVNSSVRAFHARMKHGIHLLRSSGISGTCPEKLCVFMNVI